MISLAMMVVTCQSLMRQFVKKAVARNRQFLEPYCEEVKTAQEFLSDTSDVDNIFGIVDPCGD